MRRSLSILFVIVVLFGASHGSVPPGGSSEFVFDNWAGPAIEVQLFVPDKLGGSAPGVIVMHGASRDLERYFEDWQKAGESSGFVVAVPYFSKELFPTSDHYNLGSVFDSDTGKMRPREEWAFAAIEPLFDAVVERLAGEQMDYTLYGHSAGSQFVHRFLYYVPEARVKRAIAANAGWYTMPDFGIDFPYGLQASGVTDDALAATLARDVVILLGDADTKTNEENLRQSPEAELQGAHRFERGHTFYRVAEARANVLGVEFGWQLQVVPTAEHSNAQMTPAAALLVE